MELKILDSIMHGSLKPWNLDTTNTRRFVELVKAANAISPMTSNDLHKQIKALIIDFPTLQKLLPVSTDMNKAIEVLQYKTDFTRYKTPVTNFYYLLISAETLRVYNNVLQQAAKLTNLVDIQYQIGKVLNDIKVLVKQTVAELKEQGFPTTPGEGSNHTHFALYYLQHSLIQLYFSIQKAFEAKLQQIILLDDFYMLDLELPLSAVQQIEYIGRDVNKYKFANVDVNTWTEQLNLENIEIEKIEITLRSYILTTFSIITHTEYKQVIPPHIQEKIKTNIEKEHKKNPALVASKNNSPEYFIQFSDLQELQGILVAKDNWEKVQDVFGTKENLAIEFNNLAGLRNPIRHSREVDDVSLLKGQAAIKWFKQQLKMG